MGGGFLFHLPAYLYTVFAVLPPSTRTADQKLMSVVEHLRRQSDGHGVEAPSRAAPFFFFATHMSAVPSSAKFKEICESPTLWIWHLTFWQSEFQPKVKFP
jgi:hypothetical protein